MKKDANEHSKIWDFAERLKCEQPTAVGLMENLWHWAAKEIPDGGIGKRTNEIIADRIHLPRRFTPDKMIESMVDAGLLDERSGCRLYIHDWHEHCEDSVHMKLARNGLFFANDRPPKLNRFSKEEKQRIIKEFYSDVHINAHGMRTACARHAHGMHINAHGMRTVCTLPMPMPMPMPESSPYPLREGGERKLEVGDQKSGVGGSRPPGQSTAVMEEPEDSDRVKIWREAFKILSEEVALSRLTYEHVVNAARAFPDVDLLEEAKKMAAKSRNFVNGIDEPGLWIWSQLQRCKPGAGGAVPPGPAFDPKKEMGAP